MTAPARKRGRPTQFTADVRTRYLQAVTDGMKLEAAAQLVGLTSRAIRKTATTDEDFAQALTDARAAGRTNRLSHGESAYNHHGCRCDICTKAATTGRADRRDHPTPTAHLLPITPTTSKPPSFVLARAS